MELQSRIIQASSDGKMYVAEGNSHFCNIGTFKNSYDNMPY